MSSDVVLSAALRNNLLSLQNTQKSIDATQLRLSTGLKVNSALDNPQNYFASQTLKNRASDIQRLLDGIGQNIQVIKAADAGVTALTTLVQQADSVAQNARDALVGGSAEAKVTGNVNLKGVDDLSDLPGFASVTTATLTFTVTDTDGNVIDLDTYGTANPADSQDVTIAANTSIGDLVNSINNLVNAADNSHVLEASLDEKGQLQIRALNGGRFNVNFKTNLSGGEDDASNLGIANMLGFGSIAKPVRDGGASGTNNVEFTASNAVTLNSFELYDSGTTPRSVAQRSDTLDSLADANGNPLFDNIDGTDDTYTIGINGGAKQQIPLFANGGVITIQEFIDNINGNSALNTKIHVDFDEQTGQLQITSLDSAVQSVQLGVVDNNQTVTANFGFGLNDIGASATDITEENIQLAAAAGSLADYQRDFNNIRDQIDQLVSNGDTGYRGTNLLGGDDMTTFFNEFRSSSLITRGVNFTASGLGINKANFTNAASVDDALQQVHDALNTVRSFGSSLANDLTVIQTRQDYAQTLINTLNEGADKLTVADQNEEGAKLLALQTRQQLGVTSLSLASQSQQAILRLF
jgi:flagellin-like hook-associated protein FlgL